MVPTPDARRGLCLEAGTSVACAAGKSGPSSFVWGQNLKNGLMSGSCLRTQCPALTVGSRDEAISSASLAAAGVMSCFGVLSREEEGDCCGARDKEEKTEHGGVKLLA